METVSQEGVQSEKDRQNSSQELEIKGDAHRARERTTITSTIFSKYFLRCKPRRPNISTDEITVRMREDSEKGGAH